MIKIITSLIFIPLVLSALEIKDIMKSINKINSSNKIKQTIDYNVYDPFLTAEPILNIKKSYLKNKVTKNPIILQTILNNKAFIDGKWYNNGDKIREFKVESINSDSVILSKNSIRRVLRFKIADSILKVKEQKK